MVVREFCVCWFPSKKTHTLKLLVNRSKTSTASRWGMMMKKNIKLSHTQRTSFVTKEFRMKSFIEIDSQCVWTNGQAIIQLGSDEKIEDGCGVLNEAVNGSKCFIIVFQTVRFIVCVHRQTVWICGQNFRLSSFIISSDSNSVHILFNLLYLSFCGWEDTLKWTTTTTKEWSSSQQSSESHTSKWMNFNVKMKIW